jgi:hypothetical protein
MNEELKEYKEAVRALAVKRDNDIFKNSSPEQAKLVMSDIFNIEDGSV